GDNGIEPRDLEHPSHLRAGTRKANLPAGLSHREKAPDKVAAASAANAGGSLQTALSKVPGSHSWHSAQRFLTPGTSDRVLPYLASLPTSDGRPFCHKLPSACWGGVNFVGSRRRTSGLAENFGAVFGVAVSITGFPESFLPAS